MRRNMLLVLKLATLYSLGIAIILVIIMNRYLSFQNSIEVFLMTFVVGFLMCLLLGSVGMIGDYVQERSQRKSRKKKLE